ncbi:MAG TPA: hypothetical protein VNM43_03740 [Dehalococcoidia bacterium]|nr:hypothetical protein [Dehalococcoidia bacterium]
MPEPSVWTLSQPGWNDPSPLTMLPSGRMTGTSYQAFAANPLPVIVTISLV